MQKPLVITLPPADSPAPASRGVSTATDKLFDAFLEAVLREESSIEDVIDRIKRTIDPLAIKLDSFKSEEGRATEAIAKGDQEIIALRMSLPFNTPHDAEFVNKRIVELQEASVKLALSRDLSMEQGKDIHGQLVGLNGDLGRARSTLETISKLKKEFCIKKKEIDGIKVHVDELYKEILATFAKKNELELKRIMDPALDDKEALSMLAARHKCELELQKKVAAFIELRSKWNTKRTEGVQFVHSVKSQIGNFNNA